MRNKILLISGILLLNFSYQGRSQYIQSLTITPTNPTTADTITILADCLFPSAGCDAYSQTVSVNGNDIYASALHCLGLLTVICPYTDTIIINPLPAGNYIFHFQLDAGYMPSPCTPGIVPGPNDTINFIVTPASGLNEFIYQDAVSVFPNPIDATFQLMGLEPSVFPINLDIFSSEGKLVLHKNVENELQKIDVRQLPSSIYHIRITLSDGSQINIPALKNK